MDIENPNVFVGSNSRIRTVNDLLDYYVDVHGSLNWSLSTYSDSIGLMCNYIRPHIGDVELRRLNKRFISGYFRKLHTVARVPNKYRPKDNGPIGRTTIEEVYKLLRSVFQQAIHWELMNENPTLHIQVVKPRCYPKRMLTTDQILMVLNESIQRGDYALALLIQFAFVCSMRKGEILGLHWSDINLEEGCLQVNQELSRVSVEALEKLNYKGVYHVFQPYRAKSKSRVVLKAPKTYSSIRTIYLPQSFDHFLTQWKELQHKQKVLLGEGYEDNDLVVASDIGRPFCPKKATDLFTDIVVKMGLPKVHFHSLRYSSTSYKLILSRGDIKAVQGDNGHSQPNMVLSVYAQLQDSQRIKLAQGLNDDFCSKIQTYYGDPNMVLAKS